MNYKLTKYHDTRICNTLIFYGMAVYQLTLANQGEWNMYSSRPVALQGHLLLSMSVNLKSLIHLGLAEWRNKSFFHKMSDVLHIIFVGTVDFISSEWTLHLSFVVYQILSLLSLDLTTVAVAFFRLLNFTTRDHMSKQNNTRWFFTSTMLTLLSQRYPSVGSTIMFPMFHFQSVKLYNPLEKRWLFMFDLFGLMGIIYNLPFQLGILPLLSTPKHTPSWN